MAGLAHATALFGSAVLALALHRGELDAEAAFELSRLDEAFQQARWGVDEEAAERTADSPKRHSRLSPSGSSARNRMIRPPNITRRRLGMIFARSPADKNRLPKPSSSQRVAIRRLW